MSYSQKVKDCAYALDPDAFISYSGKSREEKSALDARRLRALQECASRLVEPIDGREPEPVMTSQGEGPTRALLREMLEAADNECPNRECRMPCHVIDKVRAILNATKGDV